MPQIRIETFIEATPAEVWQTITDSELISRWLMETNIKPEVGYKGYFKMKPMPGFDGNIAAEVLEVVENKLFVYTWQGGWMKKPTTIRFTLEEKPTGTLLVLEHYGFEGLPGNILKQMMSGGWKKKITHQIPLLVKKNQMKERRDVFFAIADENRRAILQLLAKKNKPLSIGSIAEDFNITRAGVSKHIKILSESGLVTTEYSGRENLVSLQAEQLAEVYQWIFIFEGFWKVKLGRLKSLIESRKK